MRIQGNFMLDAPRADVFAAICDPDTLLAAIPGCREIERVSETEYRGVISLRLPGFVGSYRTTVRLVETDEPDSARLEGEVTGTPGSVTGRASFALADTGHGTRLAYEGQATISGPLARLDGRFAEGLAGSLISQGLSRLNAQLQHGTAAGGRRAAEEPIEGTAG